jgi:hypothetical protein
MIPLYGGETDPVVVLGLAAVWLVVEAKDRLGGDDDGEDVDDVEAVREAYVRGDISEAEMERRLALALDEGRQELRQRVEEVSGVGPETSAAIAHEFRSTDDLAGTDVEDVADRVHGVGESTAEAVLEQVGMR